MNQAVASRLQVFLGSLAGVEWLAHAGEPDPRWVVVADAVEGYDGWNREKVETWTRFSRPLETEAVARLSDPVVSEVFEEVSRFASAAVAEGLQAYYDRRPDINENTAAGADLSIWPEVLDDIKRDLAWAAVEMILDRQGFFTGLLVYYRAGRWPCSWSGQYPAGAAVVL